MPDRRGTAGEAGLERVLRRLVREGDSTQTSSPTVAWRRPAGGVGRGAFDPRAAHAPPPGWHLGRFRGGDALWEDIWAAAPPLPHGAGPLLDAHFANKTTTWAAQPAPDVGRLMGLVLPRSGSAPGLAYEVLRCGPRFVAELLGQGALCPSVSIYLSGSRSTPGPSCLGTGDMRPPLKLAPAVRIVAGGRGVASSWPSRVGSSARWRSMALPAAHPP